MSAQRLSLETATCNGDSFYQQKQINSQALAKERQNFFFLQRPELHARFQSILSIFSNISKQSFDAHGESINIGLETSLSRSQRIDLQYGLRAFIPWKKGPFNFFGERINSEWNSYLKWRRIKPFLGDLENQVIADLGCHNGYFMFKMLAEKPKKVIGFDPVIKLFYNFCFINNFIKSQRLVFEPLGLDSIQHFRGVFDRILCLGVLYHLRDPVSSLIKIHQSLRKGGKIIIDCQGIAGEGPYCLFPAKKYAGASGVWFVPTKECVIHWMRRAQFKNIHCFFDEALQSDEQRATSWAPIASLKDSLHPMKPGLTIEGYPAPRRFYLEGSK